MFEKLKKLNKLIEKYEKTVEDTGKEAVEEAFAEFFKKHSGEVQAIEIKAYVPSFNDGDPCEWSMMDPTYVLAEGSKDEGADEPEEDDYDEEGITSYNSKVKELKAFKDIEKLEELLDSDLIERLYGPYGVKLTFTSGSLLLVIGVSEDSYDCDY